jgi:putative transposase
MKKSRFTDSQIMAILKQHEIGVSVADLARELREAALKGL